MRFTKLSALALVAVSLISLDTLASPVNRKFHPVVNDDPQNAHLNVQTPGADINQTVVIKEEPGPDGQVIPVGDTKVASCVVKDANGDIDLSAAGSCAPSAASAPAAERASVAASAIGQAPSPRTVSRTPSLTSASIARAGNVNASKSAPNRSSQAVEAVRVAAPLPTHRTESARTGVSSLPGKQLASTVRVHAAPGEFARMQWLVIGAAAAMLLLAVGLGILSRMGLGNLLLIGRRVEDEEHAARDGLSAVSTAVHDPLPSP